MLGKALQGFGIGIGLGLHLLTCYLIFFSLSSTLIPSYLICDSYIPSLTLIPLFGLHLA